MPSSDKRTKKRSYLDYVIVSNKLHGLTAGTVVGTEGSGGEQETITEFVNRKKLEEAKCKLDMEVELRM
ncbi:hypothetical protein Hanom_Chr03g00193641 [Helianthus anomalus]